MATSDALAGECGYSTALSWLESPSLLGTTAGCPAAAQIRQDAELGLPDLSRNLPSAFTWQVRSLLSPISSCHRIRRQPRFQWE